MNGKFLFLVILLPAPLLAIKSKEYDFDSTPNACMVSGICYPGHKKSSAKPTPVIYGHEEDTEMEEAEEEAPKAQPKPALEKESVMTTTAAAIKTTTQKVASNTSKELCRKRRSGRDIRRYRAWRNKKEEICTLCTGFKPAKVEKATPPPIPGTEATGQRSGGLFSEKRSPEQL